MNLPPDGASLATLPRVTATTPGLSSAARYCFEMSAEPSASACVSSHVIFNASRPWRATHVLRASTATPPCTLSSPGTWTTATTPGIAFALLAST